MDKTFLVKFVVDEVKMKESSNIAETLGISAERVKYLLSHAEECQEASIKRGEDTFDSGMAFLDFIENETLEGNEVFFLMYAGYMAPMNCRRAVMDDRISRIRGMLG